MKKLLPGLMLLDSMSSFATTSYLEFEIEGHTDTDSEYLSIGIKSKYLERETSIIKLSP